MIILLLSPEITLFHSSSTFRSVSLTNTYNFYSPCFGGGHLWDLQVTVSCPSQLELGQTFDVTFRFEVTGHSDHLVDATIQVKEYGMYLDPIDDNLGFSERLHKEEYGLANSLLWLNNHNVLFQSDFTGTFSVSLRESDLYYFGSDAPDWQTKYGGKTVECELTFYFWVWAYDFYACETGDRNSPGYWHGSGDDELSGNNYHSPIYVSLNLPFRFGMYHNMIIIVSVVGFAAIAIYIIVRKRKTKSKIN